MSAQLHCPLGVYVPVLPLPLGYQLLANANGHAVLLGPGYSFPNITPAMLQQFHDAILGWATCPCTASLRDPLNPRMHAAERAVDLLCHALATQDAPPRP